MGSGMSEYVTNYVVFTNGDPATSPVDWNGVPINSWTGHIVEIAYFTNTLSARDASNFHWYATHPENEFPLWIAMLMMCVGLAITVMLILKERNT